jgi:hypothetical protein
MHPLFTIVVALWSRYSVAVGAWSIIVANPVTLTLVLFILAMKAAPWLKKNGARRRRFNQCARAQDRVSLFSAAAPI